MRIGGSLLLIAIGAILRWAITANVQGVNLHLIGVILMIVGAVALVVSLIMLASRRRTDIVHNGVTADGLPTQERTTYVAPRADDQL
jgi:uncharacterized membrane protein YhaH (DUF805 family)